jgi:2-oxoglutarate ferredoxin oxidoreductase subunit gamma
MVALGAYVGATGIADVQKVKDILSESFAAKPKLIPVNHAALDKGFEIGRKAQKS